MKQQNRKIKLLLYECPMKAAIKKPKYNENKVKEKSRTKFPKIIIILLCISMSIWNVKSFVTKVRTLIYNKPILTASVAHSLKSIELQLKDFWKIQMPSRTTRKKNCPNSNMEILANFPNHLHVIADIKVRIG